MQVEPGKPFVVNLACTGIVPTKAMNPNIPVTHDEIIDDVGHCLELGVQMFHLHARDAQECQTDDPEVYGRLIESIRALPGGKQAVLCVTTSGRLKHEFEFRSRVLELDGAMKPDMASLTLSSLNFAHCASVNTPAVIRQLAEKMQQKQIKPEIEVFDLGMVNFLKVLQKEALVEGAVYVNILLGNMFSAQASLLELGCLMAALPDASMVSVAGLGKFQLQANMLGLMFADGVRTGLEDNLWLDGTRQTFASNVDLVKRVLRLADELERPLLNATDLRLSLGLSTADGQS